MDRTSDLHLDQKTLCWNTVTVAHAEGGGERMGMSGGGLLWKSDNASCSLLARTGHPVSTANRNWVLLQKYIVNFTENPPWN